MSAATLLAVCSVIAVGQEQPTSRVLYLVEFVRTGKQESHADKLLRVTLHADGKLVKDTLVTAKARFFGDPSQAQFVSPRHIVTQYGGVIDVKDGRIVHDSGFTSELVGIENGQVVYRNHDPSAPLAPGVKPLDPKRAEKYGTFVLHLNTGVQKVPEAKHWYLDGTKSPDRNRAVYEGDVGALWLKALDGPPRSLGKGFHITTSKYARHPLSHVPVLWLDNERLLTQQGNGKLATVDVKGNIERVCEIPGVPPVLAAPRLWRDPKGRIVYTCGRADYVIDVPGKSASILEEYTLGHGFETPVATEERGFRTIYHEGKMIGSGRFNPTEVRTAPDAIAKYNYGAEGGRRWVGVLWTKLGFAWRGIDLDYGGIIGWAE